VALILSHEDEAAGEAALAIAATHAPEAFEPLRLALENAKDPWFRSVLLSAIALTRQDAAIDFLLDLVKSESLNAEGAVEAIARSSPSDEMIQRLTKVTSENPRLARVLADQKRP
jgi:hypothetical protein